MIVSPPWKPEVLNAGVRSSSISHVIFDFDGTLSWLRSGWPDVMTGLFSEYLPVRFRDAADVLRELRHDILSLNGKPSIHQMKRFCERSTDFGASPPSPERLHQLYLSRLDETLQQRITMLADHALRENFIISGALPLLDELRERKRRLIILSGTAEPDVRREVAMLGLQPYFGEHIYGSVPGKDFSKKAVIDRIIVEEGIEGAHLLSFGDGPVEIEFTKAAGGLAIGVASDERVNGSGAIDTQKREHLVRAGADAIIPDYRNLRWILETFFP